MLESEESSSAQPDDPLASSVAHALDSFFRPGTKEPLRPAAHLRPGTVVGDFRLVAPIGQGGMGQVWEAEEISLGNRRVAVKFMRPERVTEKQLAYFEREARAGGRLSHPGIVSVHSYGESDGLVWLSMELVEGNWTLRDYLDEVSRLDVLPDDYDRQVALFALELAKAMQAAHDEGVIHRDLKPQNILITPEHRPKVTDFGLARITGEVALSASGDVAGTYFYMSPEQVDARHQGLDHRSDIFSLGVVLYEMLALQRPFRGDTSHQVAQQIVTREPLDPRAIRSRIPHDLVVITGKALEKSRERRYSTMEELAADLRRFLADQPILARPPTLVQRMAKAARRNPTRSVAGAIAGLAFLVISVLTLRIAGQKSDLEVERTKLAKANLELVAKTTEAKANASAEKKRADEVERLSLTQTYEELMARARVLWPPHPDRIEEFEKWLGTTRELLDQLPELRRKRDELRREALPRSEAQRRAWQESHPEFEKLASLRRKVDSKRKALAVRRGEQQVELPVVNWMEYPEEAEGLIGAAIPLVIDTRKIFGKEALGLLLAEKALEKSSAEEMAMNWLVVGVARHTLGLDAEALEAYRSAVDTSQEENRLEYRTLRGIGEAQIEEARSETGLSEAEVTIAQLQWSVTALEKRIDDEGWTFPEEKSKTRWWNDQLTKLMAKLVSLEAPGVGLRSEEGYSNEHGWSIPRRLAFAQRLREGFAPGGEFAARWEEQLPGIRAAYPGLEFPVQVGLVPIGADPDSRLWEFWHVQSGEEPLRGADGKLVLEEASGLVLVLLPGGTFWMGAQRNDPAKPNYDPEAKMNEGPVHEVELSPFFLSKFEMTQGQWRRLTNRNPSSHKQGNHSATLLQPVEQVSWADCMMQLPRLGLRLPSEAQWEYGARGGTETPWWTGADRESLRELGAVNLADQSAAQAGAEWPAAEDWPDLDDGYVVHAPVNSFAANSYGLTEVHGNLSEWCMDGLDNDFYQRSPAANPMRSYEDIPERVVRGGSFMFTATTARSAKRFRLPRSLAAAHIGLRPARALER